MGKPPDSSSKTGLSTARFLRPTGLPALIALCVVLLLGMVADRQSRVLHEQRVRGIVEDKATIIRTKLEGNIDGNLQLVRGLVSVLATEPHMTQRRFSEIAGKLMAERSQLRLVAAAPDLVVRLIHPVAGNRAAIGLDYRASPDQREAALRARDEGDLVLAGPVELVQGGQALIGRFPVFAADERGNRRFWGIVSAVIDLDRLYAASGLYDTDLDIVLTGRDGKGAAGERFLGSADILAEDPVIAEVTLPSGSWQLAAVPKGGWEAYAARGSMLRLGVAIAVLLVVVPILVTGVLFEERQGHGRELARRERELTRLSRRLELALETSHVGVWEWDIVTGELFWDDRMNELYGAPGDGGPRVYADWRDRLHPDDLERATAEFQVAIDSAGRYVSQYRVVMPDGEIRHIRAVGAVYQDPGANPRILGVNWDVSADVALAEDLRRAKGLTEARNADLERAKARIEHTSLHDFLTGLPNRRFLDTHLERLAADGEGRTVALLHIDLDRFKQINDTLGHAAGDLMLVHAARTMQGLVGPADVLARVGGDEFVIVLAADDSAGRAPKLADEIVEAMRQPVQCQGHACRIGASIGIAVESGDQISRERLLINADLALYRAKNRGRNRAEMFNEAMQAEVVRVKRIADQILDGLEANQFVPYYQPQFCARTHRLVGVEALARWVHPDEGLIAPEQFIGIAEDLDVVSAIDRVILETALADLDRWNRSGVEVPRVSVNVSLRRLHDENLIRALHGLSIRPGTLSFELVESIYLDDSDEVVTWTLDRIKDLGIGIEIDDFGTGYASIVSLVKLKPHRLKIDRQLVTPSVASPTERQLVQSIVGIGRSLGIEIVAEGVETEEHARLLADLGCDVLQGFAFARPLSAAELEAFIRGGPRRATG